jgi:hypothetical protein
MGLPLQALASEGIPNEPASDENPTVENRPVADAVAKPFLTSIDSVEFGRLPLRN